MKKIYLIATSGVLCTVVAIFAFTWRQESSLSQKGDLTFPTKLTAKTPWDIDPGQFAEAGSLVEKQRLFEILSWQWFIALNWPVDDAGEPMSRITAQGEPRWFRWKESYEVFRADGEPPAPWGVFTPPAHFTPPQGYANEKILFRTNKFTPHTAPDVEDEIDQAFTGPIWDQNGNITRYEVRLNEVEFDYIVNNELYNYDGQIKFSKDVGDVDFPEGDVRNEGVIEIKVAWRILEASDIPSRYFVTDGYVISSDGQTYEKKQVGMVGMHISSKTKSSPQWIWTTYEHVDNLIVNELEVIDGKPLRASYNNPDTIAAINVFPDTAGVAKPRTQIQRVIPLTGATKALNAEVQTLLAKAGSPLQYYQQIGTQWPTDPKSQPYTYGGTGGGAIDTTYTLPQAVTNKSGGMPTPVYLTNMIMETYFQGGTIVGDADRVVQLFEQQDSEGAFQTVAQDTLQGFDIYMANEPAYFQINGSPVGYDLKNTHKLIFGTESCIGCHFSSNIATGDTIVNGVKKPLFNSRPASADFSWLLNQKPSFLPYN